MAFCSSRMLPGHECASNSSRASPLKRGSLPFHLGAELAHEVIGEEQDVFAPLAQRRQMNPEHRDTIVQVFAKPAVGDRTLEVAVGGGNETDVGLERRRAADPLVLPFLQHAKELGLHGRRQLADLVEEQRAAGRQLEAPALRRSAPVKAPRSWPNSSDSTSVSGSAAQLSATNGPSARALRLMDRPGQDFLAGAALAGEEHGRGGGRDLSRGVDGRDELRGTPNDRVEPESFVERGSAATPTCRSRFCAFASTQRRAGPTVDGPLRRAHRRAAGLYTSWLPRPLRLAPSAAQAVVKRATHTLRHSPLPRWRYRPPAHVILHT